MNHISAILRSSLESSSERQSYEQDYLSDTQKFKVTQALISQLELPEQLAIIQHQFARFLPFDGVHLKSQGNDFAVGNTQQHQHYQRFQLQPDITISYFFQRMLTVDEKHILIELHQCARQPLHLAWQHYQVKQLSFKDYLTGLGNRSHYKESIERQISHCRRTQAAFGLLVLDLDHFKQANDSYGHTVGDKILVTFSHLLQHVLRDTDYAFRFGGDEFACLIRDSDQQLNQQVAHRILDAVANNALLQKHGISTSIGSTVFTSEDDEQSVFVRADNALYAAKRSGRDCLKMA